MSDTQDAEVTSPISTPELVDIRFRRLLAEGPEPGVDLGEASMRLSIGVNSPHEGAPADALPVAIATLHISIESEDGDSRIEVEPQGMYRIPWRLADEKNSELLADEIAEDGLVELIAYAREAIDNLSGKVFQQKHVLPIVKVESYWRDEMSE